MPTPRIPDGRRPKERPELRAATVRSRCPPGQAQAQAQGHNTPAQRGHPTPPTRRTTSQICVSALGVGDARPRDTRTTARPETRLLRARPRRRRSPAAPESFGWPAAQAAPWPPGRAGAEQRAGAPETCAASAGPWQRRGVRRTPKSSVRPTRSHAPRRTAQHTAAPRRQRRPLRAPLQQSIPPRTQNALNRHPAIFGGMFVLALHSRIRFCHYTLIIAGCGFGFATRVYKGGHCPCGLWFAVSCFFRSL